MWTPASVALPVMGHWGCALPRPRNVIYYPGAGTGIERLETILCRASPDGGVIAGSTVCLTKVQTGRWRTGTRGVKFRQSINCRQSAVAQSKFLQQPKGAKYVKVSYSGGRMAWPRVIGAK